MALSRIYLRNVHRLANNGVSCKFNSVPVWSVEFSRNLPNYGELLVPATVSSQKKRPCTPYRFNEKDIVDAPPTFRPSGCDSLAHTAPGVVGKHYTAALQTTETSGVIVYTVKRFIRNFNYIIVCWLSLRHVEYAVG